MTTADATGATDHPDLADEPTEYVVGRVRQALAEDPRVGEQHIDIAVRGQRVVLVGEVTTPERRDAASQVVSELLPGLDVCNEMVVPPIVEPVESEELA